MLRAPHRHYTFYACDLYVVGSSIVQGVLRPHGTNNISTKILSKVVVFTHKNIFASLYISKSSTEYKTNFEASNVDSAVHLKMDRGPQMAADHSLDTTGLLLHRMAAN